MPEVRQPHEQTFASSPTQGVSPQAIQAMLQGTAAKGQLGSIKEQMKQAQSLRDTKTPEMVGDTAANPMSFIAALANRRQGRSDLASASAEAAALRDSQAKGETAQLMSGFQQANYQEQLEKFQQKQEWARQAELKRQQYAQADKVRAEQVAEADRVRGLNNDREDSERDIEAYVSPDGKQYQVTIDNKGNGYLGGELIPDFELWSQYKKPTTSSGSFGKVSRKEVEDITEGAKAFDTMARLNADFDDGYGNQTGVPWWNETKQSLSRNTGLFDSAADAAKWFSDYKAEFENIERHGLFGSALTTGEQEQWRKANVTPNMSDEEIREKLARQEDLKRMWGAQKRADFLLRHRSPDAQEWVDSQYPSVVFYVPEEVAGERDRAMAEKGLLEIRQKYPMPDNVDATEAQWNELSDKEKQQYYDHKGLKTYGR